jgi:hypothetical protein
MDKAKYKRDLEAAQQNLSSLLKERKALDKRIAQLRLDIGSLAQLAGLTPLGLAGPLDAKQEMGLTASCLEALRASDGNTALYPSEVMETILRMGLRSRDNPSLLASVHSTLKRMAKQENSDIIEWEKNGKPAYAINTLTPEQMADYNKNRGLSVSRFMNTVAKKRR